jgi:hypothetical protein
MADADQRRPIRWNLAALALLVIVVLAGALLILRFVRGVETIQCMMVDGHEARIDCLQRLIGERSSRRI